MQTIWRGECRLPAQPALFKLERKWPYIQHASNHALFSLTHTKTHTHTLTITEVSPWPLAAEGVCYCNIMFLYITIPTTVTIIIIIPIITIYETLGQTAGQEEREHEEDRKFGGKKKTGWKMKDRVWGRIRGQRFPSTPLHDLISLHSARDLPRATGTPLEELEEKEERRRMMGALLDHSWSWEWPLSPPYDIRIKLHGPWWALRAP